MSGFMPFRRIWISAEVAFLVAFLVLLSMPVLTDQSGWQSFTILDVREPADFILSARSDGVNMVQVCVTGEIDGEAEIGNDQWGDARLSGRVNWRVSHDWFQPDFPLRYRPHGATKGQLVIHCKFD